MHGSLLTCHKSDICIHATDLVRSTSYIAPRSLAKAKRMRTRVWTNISEFEIDRQGLSCEAVSSSIHFYDSKSSDFPSATISVRDLCDLGQT
jgi:hypothetical protein